MGLGAGSCDLFGFACVLEEVGRGLVGGTFYFCRLGGPSFYDDERMEDEYTSRTLVLKTFRRAFACQFFHVLQCSYQTCIEDVIY